MFSIPDKKTSIIIVTYKALDYVKKCFKSIRENTETPYEVIVVDNDSGPEMLNYLESLDWIKLIANNENRLLTPAQNQGLKEISSEGEYVLFLNPDVEVLRNDWLQCMIHLAESRQKIGIVGPIRNYHPLAPLKGNIDMACLMVKREVLEVCGPLDENYPWNGAGLVLTANAWSRGYRYAHLKHPEIIEHHRKKSRAFNDLPNQQIDFRNVFMNYNIKPRWSLMGLIVQLVKRPGELWTILKRRFL